MVKAECAARFGGAKLVPSRYVDASTLFLKQLAGWRFGPWGYFVAGWRFGFPVAEQQGYDSGEAPAEPSKWGHALTQRLSSSFALPALSLPLSRLASC